MHAAVAAVAALARDECPESLRFLAAQVFLEDECGRLADGLRRRVPVDTLGGRVPARDQPVDTAAHDGLLRGVHDRPQQSEPRPVPFGRPAGQQRSGPDEGVGQPPEVVGRAGDRLERLPLPEPVRVHRRRDDPAGDSRREQGDASNPGEQPQHQAGDVDHLNPRLQPADLRAPGEDLGHRSADEAGHLAAQQVHGRFLPPQLRNQGLQSDVASDGRAELHKFGEHLARGGVHCPLLASITFAESGVPQRPSLGADPRQRELVRLEKHRVARGHVTTDTGFRVQHVDQDLIGGAAQGSGAQRDVPLHALVVRESQVGHGDRDQDGQRDRDHNQAFRPHRPVEPPPLQPAPRVRLGRRRRRFA